MEYLIQQFLAQNNLTGINGVNYSLRDDGEGVYIDKWDYEISKPVFNQSQIDGASLQEAKTSKLAQLESLRKAFQYANLEVNGHNYINTETAQNKFFNKLANTTFPMDWRLANLSWVILDQQEALEVRDAIVARETLAYQTESDYFTEINDCTTLEEVNAINIEF